MTASSDEPLWGEYGVSWWRDGEWPRGRYYRRPRDNRASATAQSERKVADREAAGCKGQVPTMCGEAADEALWGIVQYVFRDDDDEWQTLTKA